MGVQLRPIYLSGIRTHHLGELLLLGALFSGVVIVLRLIWIYPGAWLSNFIRRRLLHQPNPLPSSKNYLHRRLDGHARRSSAGRGHFLFRKCWRSDFLSRTQCDNISHFYVIFVTLVSRGLTLPSAHPPASWTGKRRKREVEEEAARRADGEDFHAGVSGTRA